MVDHVDCLFSLVVAVGERFELSYAKLTVWCIAIMLPYNIFVDSKEQPTIFVSLMPVRNHLRRGSKISFTSITGTTTSRPFINL